MCGIARTKSTITFCASDMHHNGRSRLGDLNRLRRSLCVRRQLTLSRHASELKPGLCVAYSARLMDHAAGGPSPKDDVESMFNDSGPILASFSGRQRAALAFLEGATLSKSVEQDLFLQDMA